MLDSNSLFLRGFSIQGEIPAGHYLCRLPVIRYLRENGGLRFKQPVTFLVGENGSGKSTLLEALAVANGFNAEGGTRNFHFSTAQTHSELYRYIRCIRGPVKHEDGFFLRAESFYNAATYLDEMNLEDGRALESYGNISLHEQSHGEAFLALAKNRFSGRGLYLLDEPEAALSPMRVMALMCRIRQLMKEDSQFLIATHSPLLMAMPDADVLQIGDDGIRKINYRETEHYQVMETFFRAPERMMKLLLDESNE